MSNVPVTWVDAVKIGAAPGALGASGRLSRRDHEHRNRCSHLRRNESARNWRRCGPVSWGKPYI